MLRHLACFGPVVLVLLFAAGCPRQVDPTPAAATPAAPFRELLGPSDVLEITVYREESLSGTYRLDAEGTVVYPLLGELVLTGKTATEVARVIRAGLADGYLVDPQVSVLVAEYNSSKVTVMGEVGKPGRYPYREGMTLVEVIAEAGGPTESALLQMVRVTRIVDGEETAVEVPFKEITQARAPDFVVHPGDSVFVAESAVK